MKRVINRGLLTLTAVIILVACSPESSTDSINTDGMEPANVKVPTTLVRVFVNTQNADVAAARQYNQEDTRGVGQFQIGNYERTNFYIYAFRAKTYENPTHDAPDFRHYRLVNRDPENAANSHVPNDPALDDSAEKKHCLLDGQDYNKGLLANLDMSSTNHVGMFKLKTPLLPDDSGERELVYYPDYGSRGYNFFAYSIGDISTDDFSTTDKTVDWGQCERLEDQVLYRNFTIDGSQDIMLGYAPPIQYALDAATNLTDAEKDDIKKYGYSTFAAHRGVHPMINLHHLLTGIQFRALPGDESASHTTIDAIFVRCHNRGDFIVAHRDTTKVGFYPYEDQEGYVYVHDKPVFMEDANSKQYLQPSQIHNTSIYSEENSNIDELTDDMFWRVEWKDEYWIKDSEGRTIGKKPINERGEQVPFGDNIMVPPSEKLDVFVKSTYKLGEPDQRKFTSHYIISAADLSKANPSIEKYYLDEKYYKATSEKRYIFKPGYNYIITLVVYGLSPIIIYSYIDAWSMPGDITISDEDVYVGE